MPSIRPGRGNGALEIPFSWFGFTLVGLEVNNDLEFVDDFSFPTKWSGRAGCKPKGSGSFLPGMLL